MRLQYIAIEGVIGVGKTSLTKKLSDHFGGRILLEQHEENPFLKDFYNNPRQFAFPVQLFFLLSRYRQQQEIPQRELFQDLLVTDYMFAKDRIFASLNLEDRELILYDKVALMLERDILKPDLAIYLQSNTERLMSNIRKRNRNYEKTITSEYIRSLNEGYNRFFLNYSDSPLLIVNSTEIDFVNKEEDFEDLIHQIARPISGTQYYSPAKR
ncbi:deoxynucleoside kinase [candidate division KSB1 bacterium]|nr:deoxynucleoside kinase [candidate division KSB1 bacterium]MCH7754546.1 deoxynucleoside kinase [candidate division KSB1 bacterium]MCH8018360.1 deoxynucleoside kinase [candidate division KSB1 bacterium]MCH8873469.1 deoxynucleoside kinase [candidate division KSB1 bacterium]MCH8955226.1 deoxynucleoside kinase [candidate division KSB1 bacterium]